MARQFVERLARQRGVELPKGDMFSDSAVKSAKAKTATPKKGQPAPEPPKPAASALPAPRLIRTVKPPAPAAAPGDTAAAGEEAVAHVAEVAPPPSRWPSRRAEPLATAAAAEPAMEAPGRRAGTRTGGRLWSQTPRRPRPPPAACCHRASGFASRSRGRPCHRRVRWPRPSGRRPSRRRGSSRRRRHARRRRRPVRGRPTAPLGRTAARPPRWAVPGRCRRSPSGPGRACRRAPGSIRSGPACPRARPWARVRAEHSGRPAGQLAPAATTRRAPRSRRRPSRCRRSAGRSRSPRA